jgi:hypothetical protein
MTASRHPVQNIEKKRLPIRANGMDPALGLGWDVEVSTAE